MLIFVKFAQDLIKKTIKVRHTYTGDTNQKYNQNFCWGESRSCGDFFQEEFGEEK